MINYIIGYDGYNNYDKVHAVSLRSKVNIPSESF